MGSKTGRIPEGGYPEVSPELGGFLAGFIEAEGCFSIARQPGKANHRCVMRLGVRDDDAPLIHELWSSTGVGTITRLPAKGAIRPQVAWTVAAKADCLRLIELLNRNPPRGRKAADYAIWSAAVAWWADGDATRYVKNRDWSAMSYLQRRLHDAHRYCGIKDHEDLSDGPEGLESDWGWFLAGFVTGEASLNINKNGETRLLPRFQVAVRVDDLDLLRALGERAGIGRIYAPLKTGGNSAPAACWSIASRDELVACCEVLDRFPLRGRKLREYAIWKDAVHAYAGRDEGYRDELAALRRALQEERAYSRGSYP